jgi:hypothetical protein
MDDTELRSRLESLASRTAPPTQDTDELVARVVERSRAGRRRQALLIAAAATVVAVLVAVPAVRSEQGRDTDPASPALSTGVYTTPTRGILSDEPAFLEGMLRLPWTNGPGGRDVPEPHLDTRHVVWAGLVADEQWVLVAGADPAAPLPPDDDGDGRRELDQLDRIVFAWFSGPRDGIAQEMTLFSAPRVVEAGEPAALTDSGGRGIVVAAPDDTVEVSDEVLTSPDGTPRREYEVVPDFEGVAILHLGPVSSLDRSLSYRITRDGQRRTGPFDTLPNPDFVVPDIEFDHLRAAPPPAPGDQATTAAIDELLGRTGFQAERYQAAPGPGCQPGRAPCGLIDPVTILWAGDLATVDGAAARLTVLAVGLEGPFYVTGALGKGVGGQVRSSTCGSEIRPLGTAPADLVVVLRCDVDTGPDDLVVVAPRGATTAVALDSAGSQLATYALDDGVAVVSAPANLASVVVIGADGETIDERAPIGEVDWDP